MKKIFAIFTLLLVFNYSVSFAASEWEKPAMGFSASKVRVLQTSYYDDSGEKMHIYALHFKVKDGWKLYGKDSLGVGIAPSFDFSNSIQVTNYNFYWPKSKRVSQKIGDQVFEYDSYEKEVVIPFDLYGKIEDGSILKFDLLYGVCNEICVPVNNSFVLTVKKGIDESDFALIKPYSGPISMNLTQDGSKVDLGLVEDGESSMPITTLCYALFAAFLGGLILNIMPCVLPVLSIKLISILQHNSQNVRAIRMSFLGSVAGILFSFLVFSGLVSAISYSGDIFNWGLQFQNPVFLTFLIAVFLIFIANILGYFQINSSTTLSNYLNKKIDNSFIRRKIVIANFFSGILAVLLATPCSAPFLGAAITFLVTQSAFFTFMIFMAMGIGFAFPYLLLIAFPKLIRLLPKSGSWTMVARNILASLVFLTAIWLCYVLYKNSGAEVALTVLGLSILLLLSFKIIRYRVIKTILILALILSIICAPNMVQHSKVTNFKVSQDKAWINFERVEIQNYVEAGKVVVVDVTADWCLTCKFNKYKVLSNEEVLALLESKDVVAMRADITKPDKDVMDFINSYGRYAIPFNMVFGPNAKGGILMSELLNKEDFIKTIKKASK